MLIAAGRLKPILSLAIPIIGGMVSQNVLNLVDTAMVNHLGKEALAATGLGGFLTWMSQSFLMGMAAGVQAVAARRKGEGREDIMAVALNTGLISVLLVGIPLMLLLYNFAGSIYSWTSSDPTVVGLGTDYYQVRLLSICFVGMNFAFRAYWNAANMAYIYTMTIVVMHLLNICLNFLLIFGYLGFPALGVYGAGLASTISFGFGTVFYFYLAFRLARKNGFLQARPHKTDYTTLFKLSVPSGLQSFFFATGFALLFVILDIISTDAVAAANVLIQLTLVAILPGIALGLASATLVGQALGRGQPADATQWGWDVVKVGIVILTLLGLPMALAPEYVLIPFGGKSGLIDLAAPALRLVGLTIAIEAVGLILMHSLLGAGAAGTVMAISLSLQWIIFLPLAWLMARNGYGLFDIWLLQFGYRFIQAVLFSAVWLRGGWQSVKV